MTADPPKLTPAERAVFACIMRGQSDLEIATLLVLSVQTVKKHKSAIRGKLGGIEAGVGWWIRLARAYERNGGDYP